MKLKLLIWIIGLFVLCNFVSAYLYDGFDDGSIDTSKWSYLNSSYIGTNITEGSGVLTIISAGSNMSLLSNAKLDDDGNIYVRAMETGSHVATTLTNYGVLIWKNNSYYAGFTILLYNPYNMFNAYSNINGVITSDGGLVVNAGSWKCLLINRTGNNVSLWYNDTATNCETETKYTMRHSVNMEAGNYNITIGKMNFTTTSATESYTFDNVSFSWVDNQSNINLSKPTPINNYNSNFSTVNFSAYMNNTYSTNVSIYLDGVLNETKVYSAGVDNEIKFNKTFNEGTHTYYLNATQGNDTSVFELTSTRTFYIDTNSLNITIYNENGSLISENVSIKLTKNTTEFTYTSNGPRYYIDGLDPGEWSILFSKDGYYIPRTYTVTTSNTSHQYLDVYLTNSTYTTIFNIIDTDTNIIIPDVNVIMYKSINGSWATIESKYSDISGKVQFTYTPYTNYRFLLSKANYSDLVFNLNPILFSTYDVKMSKTVLINYSIDFDNINIIYSPTYFINDNTTTFNFLITSSDGALINYGVNLTYPGGANGTSGTNAIGEQLSLMASITGATVFDYVKLDYYYTTTLSGRRNFTLLLPISSPDGTINTTFISNRDNTYGLGIFERVLITTLIILMIVGIASMLGQIITGLALGLLLYGYFVYIGFIPIWVILPSMFIGFLILTWKSGGY